MGRDSESPSGIECRPDPNSQLLTPNPWYEVTGRESAPAGYWERAGKHAFAIRLCSFQA